MFLEIEINAVHDIVQFALRTFGTWWSNEQQMNILKIISASKELSIIEKSKVENTPVHVSRV